MVRTYYQQYPLHVKSMQENGRIAGYASVFNVVDRQRDVVEKGAFLNSIKKPLRDIKLLWQHQWQEPIGTIEQLFEDQNGLYMQAQLLLDVARAREAYSLLAAKAIDGLSIGYAPVSYQIDADTGIRKLKEVELFEISLVTMPANPNAQISVVKQAFDSRLSRPEEQEAQELAALAKACAQAMRALTAPSNIGYYS